MEFADRIRLGKGTHLFRVGGTWYVDLCAEGRRKRYSVGKHVEQILLSLINGQQAVWPEGTPLAGQPHLKAVRLYVQEPGGERVLLGQASGNQVLSDYIEAKTKPEQRNPVLLETARKDYLVHKGGSKISESWRENIDRQIGMFLAWLAPQGIIWVGEVTPKIMSTYRAYIRTERKLKDDAVRQKLAIVQTWFSWMRKPNGWIAENPVEGLLEKVDRLDPIVFQLPQVQKLISGAKERGPRWHVVMALCLYAGLRRSEAVRVRWEDLRKDLGSFRVTNTAVAKTKVRRGRQVPLFDEIVEALDSLGWQTEGRIFGTWNDLRDVSRGVSEICEQAEVDAGPRQGLQYGRHTACSAWVRLGVPMSDVKTWLGHRGELMTLENHYLSCLSEPIPIHWRGRLIGRDHVPVV